MRNGKLKKVTDQIKSDGWSTNADQVEDQIGGEKEREKETLSFTNLIFPIPPHSFHCLFPFHALPLLFAFSFFSLYTTHYLSL